MAASCRLHVRPTWSTSASLSSPHTALAAPFRSAAAACCPGSPPPPRRHQRLDTTHLIFGCFLQLCDLCRMPCMQRLPPFYRSVLCWQGPTLLKKSAAHSTGSPHLIFGSFLQLLYLCRMPRLQRLPLCCRCWLRQRQLSNNPQRAAQYRDKAHLIFACSFRSLPHATPPACHASRMPRLPIPCTTPLEPDPRQGSPDLWLLPAAS